MIAAGAIAPAQASAGVSAKEARTIRAELRKYVKKNPGVVRRRSFLRRAALVNFKLPVTIRIRNPCERSQNPAPTSSSPGGLSLTTENCKTQGTALNERTFPSATVDLGPSLGTRTIAVGGSLAAVVEFADTYDGGALGNVAIKLLPSTKHFLSSSSVPLLWNSDISDPSRRNDANFLKATSATTLLPETGVEQGCGDWSGPTTSTGGIVPAGYNSLFHGYTPSGSTYGGLAGIPGFPFYDVAGPGGSTTPAGYLPIFPGVDALERITSGGVVGDNEWIGPNPFPFPGGVPPGVGTGTSGGAPSTYGGAADTVLRTNALHLAVATGGVSVDMSTGTPASPGALPTAQGSQDITMGYSGGQANLFGNIPGKNVGIDVTVNLAAEIAGIARIVDQDQFYAPLLSGNSFPAGIFNCHQVWTGAVQNYIPGVRLTGSLRIAPAITKDGKVRIAKATVGSDANNPDRVALTACLSARSAYLEYNDDIAPGPSNPGFSDANVVARIPTVGQIAAAGGDPKLGSGLLPIGNLTLPVFYDQAFYDPATTPGYYTTFNANHPSPGFPAPYGSRAVCGSDPYPLVRDAGLTGTVGGLPQPTDPAYAGVTYKGDQASVAGDITVNPISVDVLLGDQP